ncbi:hypothetical protein [Stella humosa]|uniref:hypothetical protein n=1 Tax=Stella humosa TaxID=94 RepID=UPI0014769F72|nr:hypothetical protein [Stella humosa]
MREGDARPADADGHVPDQVDRATLRRKQGGALPESATASPDPDGERAAHPDLPRE